MRETSRATWERANAVAQDDIARIKQVVTDPEVQRQVIEALDAAIVLHQQLKAAEQQTVYLGLKTLGALQIQTRNGPMSIEDACRRRIVERFPQLKNSDIVDDPARVITAVATEDRDYFIREMKIVPIQGGSVSIVEAVDRTTPFNASRTLAYLDLLQATEDLQQSAATGEGGIDAAEGFVLALKEVRRVEER